MNFEQGETGVVQVDAVGLVAVAEELGVVVVLETEGLVAAVAERDEMRRLRAENRELQMRVELLKKATAFFASETLT